MVACCKAKFLFYPVSLNLLVAIKTFIPKGAIRIRKLKDRQHNGQKKKDNKMNNDLQNGHPATGWAMIYKTLLRKLKIEQQERH